MDKVVKKSKTQCIQSGSYTICALGSVQVHYKDGTIFTSSSSAVTPKRLSGRDTIYISAVSLRIVWTQARS